jgi:hypothetical protein
MGRIPLLVSPLIRGGGVGANTLAGIFMIKLLNYCLCVNWLGGGGVLRWSDLERFWNLRLSELERAVLQLLLRPVSVGLTASLNMSGRLSRLGKLAASGRLFTLDPFRSSLHL